MPSAFGHGYIPHTFGSYSKSLLPQWWMYHLHVLFSLTGHIVSSRKNETRDEKQQRKKAIKEERRVSLHVEFCLQESRNFKCQPFP